MKLTLTTCALGALGLTPALMGTQQEAPSAPRKVAPPAGPAQPGQPSLRRGKLVGPVVAMAPEAPAEPIIVELMRQEDDLKRAAAKLESQVAALQAELESMRAAMALQDEAKGFARAKREQERAEIEQRIETYTSRRRETELERARELSEAARARGEALRERTRDMREAAQDARNAAREVRERSTELRGRVLRSNDAKAQEDARRIESHGPSTFNIHVEDGDIHIHAHGPSNFNTQGSKGSVKSGKVDTKVNVRRFFSGREEDAKDSSARVHRLKVTGGDDEVFQFEPGQSQGSNIRFFANFDTEDEDENEFELEINGKSIDLEDLGELITEGISAENFQVGALGELGEALENLEGLEILEGLEGLEGLRGLEGLKGLEGLEGLEDLKGWRVNVDVDDDCDDEEVEECEEEEEPLVEERDLVVRETTFPSYLPKSLVVHGSPFQPAKLRFPAATQTHWLAGSQPLSAEEELLQLTREIHAEVRAMRAELDELREEVTGAPTKPQSAETDAKEDYSFSMSLRWQPRGPRSVPRRPVPSSRARHGPSFCPLHWDSAPSRPASRYHLRPEVRGPISGPPATPGSPYLLWRTEEP